MQARLMQPARWWRKWCSDMPILQKQVVRLLGQASSSSCCERNWSLFERIHSRLCNNLGAIKLSTLVFNRWNQHLLDALIKKPKADKGSPQWEEDEPVEDLTRDEMAKDARMRLAEWRARLHRTELVGDAGDEEAQDVEGGSLAEGPAPARLTRKRGRPQKQPVQEEEEVAPGRTSSDESGSGADENDGGRDESDGSGDGDDESGGCDGTDGSGEEDEGEGDEKDGCSSEEEGDSESEPLSTLRKTSH
ncbi:hypothetical protein CBR_g75895 [Chara braunii]|uniref:HAT C-terminal dimerisation domain-containing protein n=1 Tax=Chara braunii TaxID=69332 RepID=A0A388JJR8_CHABU|nr:hypothetical protein CBR_g75895 [Chara braunii]|eukprot:GBG42445.1 hypothetical protein CBR_g75895 [Chara braunii]